MRRTLVIALGIALCSAEAGSREAMAYTASQARACYPDAMRLCGAPADWRQVSFGKRAEIIACMILHQGELSAHCKKAFGK